MQWLLSAGQWLPIIKIYLVQPHVPLDIYNGLVVSKPDIQVLVDQEVDYEVSAEKYQQLRTARNQCSQDPEKMDHAAQVSELSCQILFQRVFHHILGEINTRLELAAGCKETFR
jgi:hypothetical protein